MKRTLQISCSKCNLAVIRRFVRDWLKDQRIQGAQANQIVLAVDEVSANCMIHQHDCDGKSEIEICMYKDQGAVWVEVKDTGSAFPIDRYQPRTLNELVKCRHKGGMGIQLIHRIMDTIEVEQHNSHFVYRLSKRIGNASNRASSVG